MQKRKRKTCVVGCYQQTGFNDTYLQLPKHKTAPGDVLKRIGKSQCNTRHLKHSALRLLPVFGWLRTYRVKEYLLADVVTGFTVAMFQVPQSLGYTLLASVPPVFALYNAMFPYDDIHHTGHCQASICWCGRHHVHDDGRHRSRTHLW
ncbi:hypothetical protein MRX96_025765 [Rhipicephalus microplus]